MFIKVALTEDIINQCLALHYKDQAGGKKLKQRLIWIPLILILISVYLIYTELQQPEPGQNFFMAILYIAFAFGYYFFMRNRMLKAGKQLLRSLGPNSSFEMDVDEESLTTITQQSSFTNRWTAFTGALVSSNNVLLYQADNSFSMFNKSFFDGNDFELFKTWTREKVRPVTEV